MEGTVSKSTGSWYKVFVEGKEIDARLRGKFRKQDIKATNPVTVGDKVELELDGEDYVITTIHERKNCIIRKSNKLSKQYQLIAANIDLAFLVVTPGFPYTPMGFIDRYLITAAAYHIPVIIVINKNDLEGEKIKKYRRELIRTYMRIGVRCLDLSFKRARDIEAIRSYAYGKTCLISGNSGVGKSTLVNGLIPGLDQKIGDISTSYFKGQHTTTFAQMFAIDDHSFIIDTPGLKDFGLINIDKQDLGYYFTEIGIHSKNCKFNNCIHIEEPGCGVLKALEDGYIAESRYINYLSMLDELDQLKT
ncbi:MAG: ribosome small subunit-dependent GTPase A [Bacteroidia bacterium]